MSRVRQTLTLQTSIGALPLNFTLQATIPANALSLCAATLPRPTWEPLLYYAAVLSMGFLLFGVMVASYFEADRITVADIIRRRAEMSHAATVFEKGRMFDLRSISRSGLSHIVCDGDVTVKNGSSTSAFSQLSAGSGHKSRSGSAEVTTNGHVPLSKMLSSGDGQSSGRSVRRFLERLWSSRSQTRSMSTSPPVMSSETPAWMVDHKSARSATSGNRRRWNPAGLGVAALRALIHQVQWLAAKAASSSATPVSSKSTSTGEDSPAADAWPDNHRSPVSDSESSPGRDVDDNDYITVEPKPDTKSAHLRRDKSVNDHVTSSVSSEPQSKTGYCCLCFNLHVVVFHLTCRFLCLSYVGSGYLDMRLSAVK